jgi:hypothetical protein
MEEAQVAGTPVGAMLVYDQIRNTEQQLERPKERMAGKPRCRWEDTVKINLKEITFNDDDWVQLTEYKVY